MGGQTAEIFSTVNIAGIHIDIDQSDCRRLSVSSFSLPRLSPLWAMEDKKPESEQNPAEKSIDQGPAPVTTYVRCAGCEATILLVHSHNGDPLFGGRVCTDCNDRVIAYRLELAITEWQKERLTSGNK
jgi:hypothetical protein